MTEKYPDNIYKGSPLDSGTGILFIVTGSPFVLLLLLVLFQGRFGLAALLIGLMLPFWLIFRSYFKYFKTTSQALIVGGQLSRTMDSIPYSDIAEVKCYTYKLGAFIDIRLTNSADKTFSLASLDRSQVVALQLDLEQRGVTVSQKVKPF